MIDIDSLYNALLTATFGGLPFAVIDTTQEVGRRVQAFVYPGIDDKSFQDLGADDGPISIKGLLVGDDYLAQMRVMQAICRSAGPYTLVHPWLGTLQVVHAQRAKISLADKELRVARFELTLDVFNPSAQAGLDTLSQIEVSLDVLQADAENWLADAMAPAVNLLGAFGVVQNWVTTLAGYVTLGIALTSSAGPIGAAATPALVALAAPTLAPSPGFAAATSAAIAGVPAAIAGAAAPLVPSAVAPGGATTAAAAADPGDTVATLLGIAASVAGAPPAAAPGPALTAASQALLIAAAIQAASGIDYTSQQQATAQGAIIFAALDAAISAVALAAQSDPANAAPVWRDLQALKSAFAADLNALVGRLPAVVTLTIPVAMPAWNIAQYISGDDPDAVLATYQDIIARNSIFNPALVPAGPLEVLNS